MTTEIDLLPMPKPEGSGLYRAWSYDQMRDYARANVARAVAPLQAEIDALRTRLEDAVCDSTNKIEALRAEVERLNRILGRIVACDGDSNLTIRMGADAFAAAREYLLRDQEGGLSND